MNGRITSLEYGNDNNKYYINNYVGERAEGMTKVPSSDVVINFSEQTSIHAIPHIRSSRKLYLKAFWMIVFLLALCGFVLNITELFQKYFQYPVKYSAILQRRAIQFPDVTLCPYRSLDILVIKSFHRRFTATEGFLDAFSDLNISMAVPQFEENILKAMRPFIKLYETFGRLTQNGSRTTVFSNLIKKSTLFTMLNESDLASGLIPDWEIAVRCRFQGLPCHTKNITRKIFHHPMFHKCMTFKNPNFINTGGIDRGLKVVGIYGSNFVDWDANISNSNRFTMPGVVEHGSALSGDQGVRVIIHPSNTQPIPTGEGYNVPPGSSCHIGVKVKENLHLGKPYGKCSDEYPPNLVYWNHTDRYRLNNCLRQCFQTRIRNKCGCVSGRLPLPDSIHKDMLKFCEDIMNLPPNCSAPNVTPDISCLNHLRQNEVHHHCANSEFDKSNKNLNIMKECNCYIPCHRTRYTMQYSLTDWPNGPELDEIYNDFFVRNRPTFFKQFYKTKPNWLKRQIYKKHFSFENRFKGLRDLAKINVYISDTTVSRTEETAAYTQNELLSDLGGQMGFWAGMSVCSFCEILWNCFSRYSVSLGIE